MNAKLKDLLDAAVCSVELSTRGELDYALKIIMDCEEMSGAEIDTLYAMHKKGPLFDGDVPSKSGRDDLLEKGYAAKVVVNGEQGYNACTYRGSTAYKVLKAIQAAREKRQ
jgi:hypothetical protein